MQNQGICETNPPQATGYGLADNPAEPPDDYVVMKLAYERCARNVSSILAILHLCQTPESGNDNAYEHVAHIAQLLSLELGNLDKMLDKTALQ
ncbi:MAG: hypothetical protein ACPGRX_08825 [Bdellovibrionales bacterium]